MLWSVIVPFPSLFQFERSRQVELHLWRYDRAPRNSCACCPAHRGAAERSFLTGLTHNAVVGVVSHKKHIAFCNYVVHDDDDGFKMLIEFLISGTKIRISKEKAKSFLSY